MTAIRALFAQARHELGIARLLGECVLIPTSLIILFALCGAAGAFDHG